LISNYYKAKFASLILIAFICDAALARKSGSGCSPLMFNIMKTNFSLLFYMKKPKNYQNGVAPIYLRITVNGNRSEVTTGRSCEPSQWNAILGRRNGKKEEVKSFNAYLDDLQNKVFEAHRQLTEKDDPITAERLRDQFQGKIEKATHLNRCI
jgi:hypothetical protein